MSLMTLFKRKQKKHDAMIAKFFPVIHEKDGGRLFLVKHKGDMGCLYVCEKCSEVFSTMNGCTLHTMYYEVLMMPKEAQ